MSMMIFKPSIRLLKNCSKLVFTIFFASNTCTAEILTEQEIGREVIALYLDATPLIDDNETLEYVNTLGNYISNFISKKKPKRNWTFGVIDTASINAFAAPGGYVLITKGLLDLIETEDQLAFVLAHEISHIVEEHHLTVIRKQSKMLALISKMQNNVSDENKMFTEVSGVYRDFASKGLDKRAEYEADFDGTILAARAGFNAYAGHELLFILSDFYASGNQAELFFKTHPNPLSRIDELVGQITEELDHFAINSSSSSAFERLKR